MPKIRSLDFVLLETCLFGVNQGYTGQFISSGIARVLGIFNLCYSVTVTYFVITGGYFNADGNLFVNYIARQVHFYALSLTVVIIQVRYLCRRHKTASFGRELAQLCELSTWSGYSHGCIARILLYLSYCILYEYAPTYRKIREKNVDWSIIHAFLYWLNFVPTATTEFIGQAMLLVQHEFQVLCKMTEGMVTEGVHGIKKLRALNRRHASLSAVFNKVARFTGTDSLLIIESERLLLLVSVFIHVNFNALAGNHWSTWLLDFGLLIYRIERIAHYCFRGHRIIVEAKRFASTLDKIVPLDLENDEFFAELQIFRKQVRLRRLQFDCNHLLKLDTKLFINISKNLFTVIIILIQLTTNSTIGTARPTNTTEADNVTEYLSGFSDLHPESLILVKSNN